MLSQYQSSKQSDAITLRYYNYSQQIRVGLSIGPSLSTVPWHAIIMI